MELNEHFEWEGRTIKCRSAGKGPPVVFCHGTPFSSRVWALYAAVLSDNYTVHIWDMPGYGESSKAAAHSVDFDSQARALVALVRDFWKLESPHVIAHDFGGCTALRATLVHGLKYSSLMLLDPVAIPPIGSPFFRFVQKHDGVLDELPSYVHEAVVRAYIENASHVGLSAAALKHLVAPWLTEEGQPAFYRQIAHFDPTFLVENERLLGNLDMPVHLIWAANDTWIPVEVGRRLSRLIPGCQYTEVPEAGHLIQFDAPIVLSSLLRSWLMGRSKN